MPTSTTTHERELTEFRTEDRQLWERVGLDRKGIRYEFSNTDALSLVDQWIESGDELYVDHRTVENADPTGIGEGGGAGVSFMLEDGDRIPTTRYPLGYTTNREDVNAGNVDPQRQRDAILEMFDFGNDARFLHGHYRGDGTWKKGVFEWLDDNIPSERIFDCSLYIGGESGDVANYSGVEENLIKYDAYRQISNELMDIDNPMWGLMVGNQDALSHFNKVNEGSAGRATYWERLNGDDSAGVGVADQLPMPDELTFDRAVDEQEPTTVSLVNPSTGTWDGLGDDEVYLLPGMEQVRQKLWRLYETPSPTLFTDSQEMGRRRFDYVTRYAHDFDLTGHHGNATDCVKLKNVSTLFT